MALAIPSLRTRCAVLPRRALQSVVSTSGLARQAMGIEHREQPKVGEEGIRPPYMIVEAVSLTRSALLLAQHCPQSTANKAVDRRECVPMGMLEVAIPALQDGIERRNRALDGVAVIAGREGTDFVP